MYINKSNAFPLYVCTYRQKTCMFSIPVYTYKGNAFPPYVCIHRHKTHISLTCVKTYKEYHSLHMCAIFFCLFVKTSREHNSLHLCAPRFLTYASWIPCIYSAQENQRVAVRKKKSPWWEALKDNVSCRSATFQGIYPEVHTICMYDCLIQSGVRSAGNGSQVSLNNRSLLDKNRSLLEKSPICVWVESWNIRSLLNKVSILVIVVSLNIMLLLEEGPILAWQCP